MWAVDAHHTHKKARMQQQKTPTDEGGSKQFEGENKEELVGSPNMLLIEASERGKGLTGKLRHLIARSCVMLGQCATKTWVCVCVSRCPAKRDQRRENTRFTWSS